MPAPTPAGVFVELVPREPPLAPCAAAATGAAARALAARLLEESDEHLASLRGLAGPSLLAVMGDAAALPWVDGVIYLGRDPAAPRLLLPTALAPSVAAPLYEAAVERYVQAQLRGRERSGGLGLDRAVAVPPFAVLPSPRWVFSMAAASSIHRARLAAWREAAA